MIYIKTFNDYKQNDIVGFYQYIDSIFFVNEGISSDKIRQHWNKILHKVENLPEKFKKKALRYALISLLSVTSYNVVLNVIETDKIKDQSIRRLTELIINEYSAKGLFKFPSELRLSQSGRDAIKKHEGIKLKAYKLGDGMITLGWGHAEPINKSKYKPGQEITMEEAKKLFNEDVQIAADGVRRIFSNWEKEGIYIQITQDQFDALVSMAFNIGVRGLKNTEKTKISKKFAGLQIRRNWESEQFLSYLKNNI